MLRTPALPLPLSLLLLLGAFAGAASAPGSPAVPQALAAAGPPASPAVQDPPATQDPAPTPAQDHERLRARAGLATTLPRSHQLLRFLEDSDPATYAAVLAQGAALAKEREAAALGLAQEHHPELARLLHGLRERRPRAYQAAIRELVGDAARLQRARLRGAADHAAALEEWRARSRVRLAAARLAVGPGREGPAAPGPAALRELEELLTQEEAARRQQIELQIERLQQQIERLRGRLEKDPASLVERQLRSITRRATNHGPNQRRRK